MSSDLSVFMFRGAAQRYERFAFIFFKYTVNIKENQETVRVKLKLFFILRTFQNYNFLHSKSSYLI